MELTALAVVERLKFCPKMVYGKERFGNILSAGDNDRRSKRFCIPASSEL